MTWSQPGCAASGSILLPQRCSAKPASARTRSTALCRLASGLSQSLTISRTSVPSGMVTLPGGPTSLTGPEMRFIRKTRGAPRSLSCPATYQRPRLLTTPHGSRVRLVTSDLPPARWSKETGRRSRTASHSAPNAGSWVVSRGWMPGACAVSPSASASRLAARSLSAAPAAAPSSAADCQTRDAMPSTAASSGSRWISGSS